jgi:hypothetical protein
VAALPPKASEILVTQPSASFVSLSCCCDNRLKEEQHTAQRTMDSTMNNATTTTTRQRKTMRRPLKFIAAAICMTALPVASLTMRKSNVSTPNLSGSSRDLSEFMPSSRRTQSTLTSSAKAPNGSVLKMICDERQEFEVNLGKAVDTLKHDYPDILTEPPGAYEKGPCLSTFDSENSPLVLFQNYYFPFSLL